MSRSRYLGWSDKCGAHNLLKPSMYDRLDQGEGYTSCVGGFTSIEMRLVSLIRPDLIQDSLFIWLGVELLIYM